MRNYIVAGDPSLTVSQAGFNLYIGNNPENDIPYYRPVSFASSSPFKQSIHFNVEASKRAGKKLSAQQASAYWMHEVFEIAKQQPAVFSRIILTKTLAFFNQFEAGDHYHVGFISSFVPFFAIPMLSFWMVFPLGMAGMVTGLWTDRKIASCASVFALYGMTLVAFFCNTRYRLPMLVILIPLAVCCCENLYKNIKLGSYRRTILILLVALFFAIVEFLPLSGTDDRTAYYNTHALVLNRLGKQDEAIGFWKISSQMDKPYSAFANLVLARIYMNRGENEKMFSSLEKIQHNSFAASNKYELLGDISLRMGRVEEAESYYRSALDINTGKVILWKKLIRLLKKKDKGRAIKEEEHLKYIWSFYRPNV